MVPVYQKPTPENWSRFIAPVSGACVMGVSDKSYD